jgi:hypothetical protein
MSRLQPRGVEPKRRAVLSSFLAQGDLRFQIPIWRTGVSTIRVSNHGQNYHSSISNIRR